MATGVYGGDGGAVGDGAAALAAIGEWSVSVKGEPGAIVDSATVKATTRASGPKSWTGRYRANGGIPYPLLFPVFGFVGSIDGVNGLTGSAVFDSIKIDWDIAGGKPLSHEVAFTGNGALSMGAAVAVDAAVQAAQSSQIAVPVNLATPDDPTSGQTWIPLPQILTMSLEFKRANTQYFDSSSLPWKGTKAGPLDCSLSIKLHPDSVLATTALSALPQPNDVMGVQMFVDDTLYYELNWMMFSDLTDVLVNRATQEAVAATLNAAMCGIYLIGGTDVSGSLAGPATVPIDIWSVPVPVPP